MLGGIWGKHRELMTTGDAAFIQFEKDVDELLGEAIRADENNARAMWSALANINWINENGKDVSYSFRAAGDLVAAIRRGGDYMDWYCSGPYAIVADWISNALATRGWKWVY